MSVYGCYCVWVATMEAFQQRSVSFVLETTYLHWNTGFPAVTVCEKSNRKKIWDLTERFVAYLKYLHSLNHQVHEALVRGLENHVGFKTVTTRFVKTF
jgi:hypothetical protein